MFVRDLVDRGARRTSSRLGAAEQFAGIGTALTALLALLDVFRKTLDELVGAPGVVIQLVLVAIAIGGCIYIISARTAASRSAEPTYRFGPIFRTAAKVLILVLLVYLLPRRIAATADHYAQVPALFGGYLVDARTGEPIVNASARLQSEGQGDVGGTAWPSDSNGFYIVQVERPVPRRQATLAVYSETCGSHKVTLTKSSERPEDPREKSTRGGRGPATIFRHVIDCKASQ
jgi:hypothetical protein